MASEIATLSTLILYYNRLENLKKLETRSVEIIARFRLAVKSFTRRVL